MKPNPASPAVTGVREMDADREMARRLCARDPLALAALYDRFGAPVYRLALRIVRDRAAAEDLTQETFLAAWNRIAQFDAARGAMAAWILTIARHRALDYLRSAEFRLYRNSSPLAEAERYRSNDAGFDRRLDWERTLGPAWRDLRREQRRILRLAHCLGMSQPEIARRLQRPLGTVKTWMRQGHEALRAALGSPHAV